MEKSGTRQILGAVAIFRSSNTPTGHNTVFLWVFVRGFHTLETRCSFALMLSYPYYLYANMCSSICKGCLLPKCSSWNISHVVYLCESEM